MSITPRGMTVTEAYRDYRSGNLLVNRKYQRKLVWTREEKEKLIGSILRGYPIPLFLFAERSQIHGSGKYEIIDGMQRLNAIFSFIENSFSFEDKYYDLNEYSYAKQLSEKNIFQSINKENSYLSPEECANLLDYQLAVTIYPAMEEEDITEIFGRFNSGGKRLSSQERRQAGVTTPFAEVVRKIAMELRGDVSQKILRLSDMPEISIDFRQSSQDYKIKSEDTFWCKQGILQPIQLRESEDEQMIADIAASILLNKPLPVDSKRLDGLYDRESKHFKEIESTLAVYTPQKLSQDIIETFSIFRETIEAYSTESKCLRNIVNPESTNPIRSGFYTIFMTFFDLVIKQKMTPTEPERIMKTLSGFQQKLNLSRNYKTIENREDNINQTKGLIQNYFARQEPPTLGEGVELLLNIENSLRRSRIETSRYECKQGLLDLSKNRIINKNLITRIIETICGIANLGKDGDGYIFLGVVDKQSDADKIKELDHINPTEINGRYIVGIDREAKILGKSIEDYVKILTNAILTSELSNPLKTQVMTKFDTISYKGHHTLIRITVPVQNEVSFVGNKVFIRQDSSTVEVNGKELIAISKLFS
ncbi:MAG: GmrSD restriction endonuclease domain-containing protein [Waterburya sp.]